MASIDLEARWSHRDAQYAARKTYGAIALTPEEVIGIVAWRRGEAERLPGTERVKALARLAQWVSPRGRHP
jgi:hypothetical protein